MRDVNNVTLPFYHPFVLTLCGPSQCGKTYWVSKLLTHVDVMITPSVDKIVFLYSTYQPMYDTMREIIEKRNDALQIAFVDCNKGIPDISEIQPNSHENTLIILDDLMTVVASSKENTLRLDNFACRDAHHNNISVIFVCQNLMYGNGILRNSRVNSQYIVMFKNLADSRNMYTLMANKKIKRAVFSKVLAEINNTPYGYILFDNCVKGYDNARIRTNIFPDETTIIYDM